MALLLHRVCEAIRSCRSSAFRGEYPGRCSSRWAFTIVEPCRYYPRSIFYRLYHQLADALLAFAREPRNNRGDNLLQVSFASFRRKVYWPESQYACQGLLFVL